MRAVNLIPLDERRGSAAAGRSGSGVYLLLGGLGTLLVLLVAYVLVSNTINQRKGELVRVSKEAARVEAQAEALKPYRDFAELRQKRVATVTALATSRFDWERTMRQIARVLPGDVSLTSLTATVAPGVTAGGTGGGATTNSVRGAVNAPAVELVGCTSSQAEVSRVMSRLRRMTGVTRVTLSSSETSEQQQGGSNSAVGAAASTDCKSASTTRPQFSITVFFQPLAGAAQAAPGTPGAPAPGPQPAPAPSGGSGAQPASNPASGGAAR